LPAPQFTKKAIGQLVNDKAAFNTFSAVGDINGNGRPDVVLCGRIGNLAWFENPGNDGEWKRHLIDDTERIECGGQVYDITGNGLGDIIVGGDGQINEVFWWENAGKPDTFWKKRIVAHTQNTQFHDTIIGDVTGDGVVSVVFTNQRNGTTLYRIPIPKDATEEPWPDIDIVAEKLRVPSPMPDRDFQPEEGLAIGDIDGDGKSEIVCGTRWCKYINGNWAVYTFAPPEYLSTKCQVADIDNDGKLEIILSEGDPCIYGKPQGGKAAWFKAGDDITQPWTEHVLEDNLLDAHSLGVGDICKNGNMDIMVGEIGVGDYKGGYKSRAPRILVFENDGKGNFTRHVIDEGTGIHDAVLADMRGAGVLDIVGKPLHGPERWNVHVYFNDLT
jgi:hypothetical protein